ncbi:MAG TPA: hypothetical protein VIK59_11995 [Verrucomicrobiae bacterium]
MKTQNKTNDERGEMTAQKIQIPPVCDTPQVAPIFCRLPRPKTRCPLTGLSRTSLVELIDAGKVRAVRLRKKGAARGVTLVNRQSLLDFLHSLETQVEAT